jgi:hypothetical protein
MIHFWLSSHSLNRSIYNETDGGEDVLNCRLKLEGLDERRENIRVAYTTSRHIDRVRLVLKHQLQFPTLEKLAAKDYQGELIRIRWERYLDHARS